MTREYKFLGFDFGAESGRAVLGTLSEGNIALEEIHRFPTQGLTMLGVRQWDVTRIYGEMLEALRLCVKAHGPRLDGIGIDTWGVDFGLLARDGTLLANPVHYRDARNDGMMEAAFEIVPREELYRQTGIQFMQFNTVYQLLSMVQSKSPLLDAADCLLMMGDLFAYLLSGQRANEYTLASTTQLLDPATGTWNDELIAKLGLPRRLLLDPTPAGTVLGPLLPDIAAATGLDPATPVIASAHHDTGAAVAAVPAIDDGADWAYLSSGTWSLLGAELDAPHVSDASCALSLTNEGGVGGKIRFLKNISGLWLVQECRRAWAAAGDERSYAELTAEAEAAAPFAATIDIDDPRLLAPASMPDTLAEICRETGQTEPASRGATIRCALESLALKYRRTLRDIDGVLGRQTTRLHIVGGGVQNRLLNQMTADACGAPVLAGPVEATALGNIMVQALGVGAVDSLAAARQLIAASFPPDRYEPRDTETWAKLDG